MAEAQTGISFHRGYTHFTIEHHGTPSSQQHSELTKAVQEQRLLIVTMKKSDSKCFSYAVRSRLALDYSHSAKTMSMIECEHLSRSAFFEAIFPENEDKQLRINPIFVEEVPEGLYFKEDLERLKTDILESSTNTSSKKNQRAKNSLLLCLYK
ncbi:hypothetical protein SOPP22_04440 [Shewanella sp. OPT22]|nr:hypothetical protein SOPP22_04440 [Shewanella sp. OPT22]